MNTLERTALILIVLFSIIPLATATDWTIGNPTGLGYTNIITDQFTITNNNATTGGFIDTIHFSGDSTYSRSDIFQNCDKCLYGMINPTDNTRWGSDESGNLFYTTSLSPIDYSHGFFATGVTGTCYSAGGNCNNLHRVATFAATNANRKLSFDSEGNVYIGVNLVIYRFVKSLGYSQQTFKDFTADSGGVGGGALQDVMAISVDSVDNVHIISSVFKTAGGAAVHADKLTYSESGILLNHTIIYSSIVGAPAGINGAGMVLDSSGGTYNYTWAAHYAENGNTFLYHHDITHGNGTGLDIGGGALTGITNVSDIGYNNLQIYLASPAQNLIRSYVTAYTGYGYSNIPTNEAGLTGTFSWLNGYGTAITTITPGAALSYRWTISNELSNYTFFSGWSTDTQTDPGSLHDLTDLSGLGKPAVFQTSSNDLAGTSIYGYLLARRNNDSQWSMLTNPQILTITPASVGYDSITLDKDFYNLTGDTISATFTYSSSGTFSPYVYKWQICSRADCADGQFFNQISLIGNPSSSSMATDGMQEGNYYAVMMRHLPVLTGLTNEIVASQRFEVRPPVIGVSWDKPAYNLFPKSLTSNTCQDATPTFNPWSNISGYAGLQRGWFSCSSTPSDSNANNSIMRGSLYARYNGTFYLNNSLGNIWNGTLSNGSGALVYVLTNSSATETWTIEGVNESGETFYANTEVNPESMFGYSLSVSPNPAYNTQTLSLTFTKPIFTQEYVVLKDAGGTVLASFNPADGASGSYYIDPLKQYTYGTWTAYWSLGSIGINNQQGQTIYTFTVKNKGAPKTNASIEPDGTTESMSSDIVNLLDSNLFWALIFTVGMMVMVAFSTNQKKE